MSAPTPPTGGSAVSPDTAPNALPPSTDQTEASPQAAVDSIWAGLEIVDLLTAAGLLAVGLAGALIVHAVLFRLLNRLVRGPGPIDGDAVNKVRKPVLLLLIVAGVHIVSPSFSPAIGPLAAIVRHALTITLIIAAVWLLIRVLDQTIQIILRRYDTNTSDNLQARQVQTQVVVVRRILTIGLGALGAGAILMTFPAAKQIGTSILASAGIAGIAVGIAARPVIENLLAGLQIAFTQPLRLDDVVIIDDEWGRVEEITSTFVVVRIWDQRRLIVPLSKVISESFQNWTRSSAEIMGTVFMYVDYTIPVEPIRAWLKGYVGRHPKWDQRVCVLQVTDVTERTVQLRALISAANAGDAFDLRCDTREAMMAYIQREFPYSLPQVRSPATGGAAVARTDGDSGD
jgi:uncharacterized membrane protein